MGVASQMKPLPVAESACRQRGRILIEVILLGIVPCLCMVVCGLCNSELLHCVLIPSSVTPQPLDSVTGAVRIDEDLALTVTNRGQLRMWSFSQEAPLGEMVSRITDVCCMAHAPQQKLLAVGSRTGQLEVWDLENPGVTELMQDRTLGQVHECLFTPDGLTLVTASDFGQLTLWDSRTLNCRAKWLIPEPRTHLRSLAISDDGHLVLAGTFLGTVHVWDLASGQHLRRHVISGGTRNHPQGFASIDTVAFVAGNREFVATSRNAGVGIWNVETGALVRRFVGRFADLKNGEISADGSRFMAGMMDGRVVVWQTATGQRIGAVQRFPSTIKCLLFSADGQKLLTGDWSGQVRVRRL